MVKKFFNNDMTENIGAFISGDLLATFVALNLFNEVAMPIVLAALTGVLGGFFALLGKDFYKWVKSKLKK